MTIPPDDKPYESDIRANTSTGLGGLFSQLAAIAAGIGALPQVVSLLTEIRDRLTYLTGGAPPSNTLFGNTGLPGYLSTVLGARNEVLSRGQNVVNTGFSAYDEQSVILQALYGNFANQGSTNTVWLIYQALTGGLTGLQAQLNSTNQVLGDVEAAPIGSTIKDLLRSIDVNALRSADCCEDGGTVDPPPEEPPANPLPAVEGTCAEGRQGPFQCTGIKRLNQPELTPAIFGLKFDGLAEVSTWLAVQDSFYGADFLHYESNTDKQVCLVWDITGNPQPSQGGYSIDGGNPPIWSSGGTQVFNVTTTGPASFFDSTLADGVAFHVRLVLDDPALLPNYRNFWLYWSEAPV